MVDIYRKLFISIEAFRLMSNVDWDGVECLGDIERTVENCELIKSLNMEGLLYCLDDEDIKPAPGVFSRIHLQPCRGQAGFFAKDLDDLLAQACFVYESPVSFYVADQNEIYPDPGRLPSHELQGYLHSIALVKLLREVADHEDTSSGSLNLVFLHKEKLNIPIIFNKHSLNILTGLNKLTLLLAEDVHQEQRRTIFKNILLEDLKPVDYNLRFGKLLANFDEFMQRFIDNYQMYVSEFSFDKVFREINDKRLEYVLKLNKNFSDMQNQLLSIPLAALLVTTQMKKNALILTNCLIFFAAIVFSLFLSMLIRNQRASLDAIKQEIDQQKHSLQREQPALSQRFDHIYQDLGERYNKHKILLHFVDLSVAILMVMVPASLFYFYGL